MKLAPVFKIAENLINEGFTFSKCKENTIYNVATSEKREIPPDVFEAMTFLDGFTERLFKKISNN
jgi:hypothetical protein